jgi:lipopolysaccharide biosynthesis glycosyltransferase
VATENNYFSGHAMMNSKKCEQTFSVNDHLIAQFSGNRKRCIYSFALGDHLQELRNIVMPTHLSYAKKAKADYYCFTQAGPGLPSKNNGLHQQHSGITYNKIFYAKMLSHYESILYLDLDVVVTSRAPLIFARYQSASADFIAFNESFLDPSGVREAISEIVAHCGGQAWSPDFYFNTGVFLARGKAAAKFVLCEDKLFTGRWSEQTYLNWLIHNKPFSWKELDRRYNTIVSVSDPLSLAQAYFIHFAGMTSPGGTDYVNEYANRNILIKKHVQESL